MTTPVDTEAWVAGWLDDFRLCLHGAHGAAWRARAEQELRSASTVATSDRQRASSWARTRIEVLGESAA
ncbi:hypothetical protein GCM10023350_17060 [Nocardioides endophyticus]|uniref:Uncharacterized protein n=1 Tax=Nocardioides endophyticus TaxID=1353775 RepID=A0ABP8YNW5_9ACTN